LLMPPSVPWMPRYYSGHWPYCHLPLPSPRRQKLVAAERKDQEDDYRWDKGWNGEALLASWMTTIGYHGMVYTGRPGEVHYNAIIFLTDQLSVACDNASLIPALCLHSSDDSHMPRCASNQDTFGIHPPQTRASW
jgi:hypothetical protein